MFETVTFQALPSLSSCYMLFQWQAIIADSESAKNACKSHTVSAENSLYYLLLILDLVSNKNWVEIQHRFENI